MLELFVQNMLTTTAPASVASVVGNRVYVGIIPKDCTYPAVRYTAIDFSPGERTSSGKQHSTKQALFQIDIYGNSYLDAALIANAINEHFDGYHGTVDSAYGNYVIQLVEVTSQRPDFESDLEIHSQTIELTIIYQRV
ncbi:MAG: hypothetical protein MK185_06580 [Saccharospirillaceae bacterium]|nr:hypothetical protein [Saccharospirillaceae bacterium]